MKINPLIVAAVLGGGFLLLRSWKPSSPDELVHYPRDLAEVRKLGGFFNLSPEQQAYIRYRYIDELRTLMETANEHMQLAQFSGDLASCYTHRALIKRLQDSMDRVQRLSVDPTGEQQVIMNVSVFLGSNGNVNSNTRFNRVLQRR